MSRMPKDAARVRAAQLNRQGWSQSKIAQEVGWSRGEVGRWLRSPPVQLPSLPHTGPALHVPAEVIRDPNLATAGFIEISGNTLQDAVEFLHQVVRGDLMPDGEPATPRERIAASSILLSTALKIREIAGKDAGPVATVIQLVSDRVENG